MKPKRKLNNRKKDLIGVDIDWIMIQLRSEILENQVCCHWIYNNNLSPQMNDFVKNSSSIKLYEMAQRDTTRVTFHYITELLKDKELKRRKNTFSKFIEKNDIFEYIRNTQAAHRQASKKPEMDRYLDNNLFLEASNKAFELFCDIEFTNGGFCAIEQLDISLNNLIDNQCNTMSMLSISSLCRFINIPPEKRLKCHIKDLNLQRRILLNLLKKIKH